MDDLPLLAWTPPPAPSVVVPFPLARRLSYVRDVAGKLATKTTARHAAHYRDQVETAIRHKFDLQGIATDRQASEIRNFWTAVTIELARYHHQRRGPGAA